MNTVHIACVVMALLAVATVTQSCSCNPVGPRTAKDYLCSSDFAVTAMVSNWTLYQNNITLQRSTFFLRIIDTFKVPSRYENDTWVEVHSYANDGMCGINPGRGNPPGVEIGPYFLTANVREGILWTLLCANTLIEWERLSITEESCPLVDTSTPVVTTVYPTVYTGYTGFPNVGARGSEKGCLQVVTSILAVTLFTVNSIFNFDP